LVHFYIIIYNMPGLRVKAWLSIPNDQRPAVDKVMEVQVAPINLRMLAEATIRGQVMYFLENLCYNISRR